MTKRPSQAQYFLWWFLPVAVFLIAYFTAIHEGSTAYLYPHEEAKVYFDNFHEEGYKTIESVEYIGSPRIYGDYPSRMEAVIDGKAVTSDILDHALIGIDPAFNLNLFSCPEGLSAKRTEQGWVYEVTPEIKDTQHRRSVEACIGMTVAGVYEIKKQLEIANADDIKAARERKESWETALRPE